jgi:hypothetical protein
MEANKTEEIVLKQLSDKKQACEKLEVEIKMLKSELEKEMEIVQRSWMKLLVVKGHQTTRMVWDTPKTQLLHHKDLSKYQLVMHIL